MPITPIIETMKYFVTANNPKWKAVAVEGSDTNIAQVHSDISEYCWSLSNGKSVYSSVVLDTLTKGMGYFYVDIDQDLDNGKGDVTFSKIDPYDVYSDPMSRDFLRQMPSADQHLSKSANIFFRMHVDPILLGLLLTLCTIGLFILYSASGQSFEHVERQAARLGVAFLVMLVFAQLDPVVYKRWSPWLFLIGVVALMCVLFFGVGAKGAQRWLHIPGLPRFQPSEFMKLIVPMMVAWYLSSRYLPPSFKVVFITLIIIFVPVVLVVKQPDLGTSLLIASSGIFVLMLAGLSLRFIAAFAALIAAFAPILWLFIMHDYQRQRVLTFLNPESDPLGSGWNIIQSKTAIGSGGIWGKDWLNGTQSHLEFLPERSTDFIFAVLCEEFGMLGVILLLLIYLLIIIRGLYISYKAQDAFRQLLAAGITLTFFVYIIVNMGMVAGQLPVVGVPLPLVSFGGTSIVTLMIGFGILMSIHTHKRFLKR